MSVPNKDAWKELCEHGEKHRLYHAMKLPCPCFTIKWGSLGAVPMGSDPPSNPCKGQIMWMGRTLYVFDGMQWQVVKA